MIYRVNVAFVAVADPARHEFHFETRNKDELNMIWIQLIIHKLQHVPFVTFLNLRK